MSDAPNTGAPPAAPETPPAPPADPQVTAAQAEVLAAKIEAATYKTLATGGHALKDPRASAFVEHEARDLIRAGMSPEGAVKHVLEVNPWLLQAPVAPSAPPAATETAPPKPSAANRHESFAERYARERGRRQ